MPNRQENMLTGRTWVVVADSNHAQIYLRKQLNSPLKTVVSMEDRQSQGRDAASDDDDAGGVFRAVGHNGRGRADAAPPGRRNGRAQFAREVVERVERGRTREEFEELILIAPPQLLGIMRESLTKPTLDRVSREIAKNLVALEPERIKPYLSN